MPTRCDRRSEIKSTALKRIPALFDTDVKEISNETLNWFKLRFYGLMTSIIRINGE